MQDDSTPTSGTQNGRPRPIWALIILGLALFTLLLNGYHPLAEDGGLYVAGVQYTLNPTLFPHYTIFVTEHLRFSIFAPTLAFFVRHTHLSLAWVLLLTNLFSIWLTFVAAHKLLQRTIANPLAQLGGLSLLAAFWSIPIAGTSLLLMDPYVTGRSLSTPLSILAVAFALDFHPRRLHRMPPLLYSVLCLIVAALFHPLMAAYAAGLVFILCLRHLRHQGVVWISLGSSACMLAAVLQHVAPAESPAIVAAEASRNYWFLSQWQWFELLGIAGPIVVLYALLRHFRTGSSALALAAADLCRANIVIGCIATLVCLLFAHESGNVHLVARMQPLRVFLLIYVVMTLLLGSVLTRIALQARRRAHSSVARIALASAPVLILLVLSATMFYVQRQTFPASEHLELPWRAQRNPNPWVQAFLWARDNTPTDALFALDTKYVNEEGEDAQTFRATARRSAVPDFSKDGGEAAITPQLADQWLIGADAQRDLSTEPDSTRFARLEPFGVTWLILHANAVTAYPCPYNNGSIKVCRFTP
jgi:hypothetical protein